MDRHTETCKYKDKECYLSIVCGERIEAIAYSCKFYDPNRKPAHNVDRRCNISRFPNMDRNAT